MSPGDVVEIRDADEILRTLDSNSTVDDLPFMPEMLAFCGKKYPVTCRVIQAVIDGARLDRLTESYVRAFRNDDVVLFNGLRCSGLDHGRCQRGCTLFWKEAWLRKIDANGNSSGSSPHDPGRQQPRLKTMTGPEIYFCQSSEFRKATRHISWVKRILNWFRIVFAGNNSLLEMVRRTAIWAAWKIRRRLLGEWPRGNRTSTPAESLNLQPGELVEVKSLTEIRKTLDNRGRNRRLHFTPEMSAFCGKQFVVLSRTDRLITEGTGLMRGLGETVILKGAICDSSYYSFGGCPRADFQYWREIWLRRVRR